jgi:hypothetical protein
MSSLGDDFWMMLDRQIQGVLSHQLPTIMSVMCSLAMSPNFFLLDYSLSHVIIFLSNFLVGPEWNVKSCRQVTARNVV